MRILNWIKKWIQIGRVIRDLIKNNPELKYWFQMHSKCEDGHFIGDSDFCECIYIFVRILKKFFIY